MMTTEDVINFWCGHLKPEARHTVRVAMYLKTDLETYLGIPDNDFWSLETQNHHKMLLARCVLASSTEMQPAIDLHTFWHKAVLHRSGSDRIIEEAQLKAAVDELQDDGEPEVWTP